MGHLKMKLSAWLDTNTVKWENMFLWFNWSFNLRSTNPGWSRCLQALGIEMRPLTIVHRLARLQAASWALWSWFENLVCYKIGLLDKYTLFSAHKCAILHSAILNADVWNLQIQDLLTNCYEKAPISTHDSCCSSVHQSTLAQQGNPIRLVWSH